MNQQTPGESDSPARFEDLAENPVSRRGWILASMVLALVVLGFGAWTAWSTAATVHRTFSPVYFWDQWTVVSDLQRSNGVLPLSRLWAQHNEHRILVGRLALFADLKRVEIARKIGGTGVNPLGSYSPAKLIERPLEHVSIETGRKHGH